MGKNLVALLFVSQLSVNQYSLAVRASEQTAMLETTMPGMTNQGLLEEVLVQQGIEQNSGIKACDSNDDTTGDGTTKTDEEDKTSSEAKQNETENKDAEEDDTDSDDEDNFIDEDDDLETEKEEAEMIALDKEDMLPTNTTLTQQNNNMSPLENAAGVTQIEDEELQKADKIEAAKVPEHKIQEARPSNSTTIQTGNELADQLTVSLEDTKDKKPVSTDLTTTGAAVETGSTAKAGEKEKGNGGEWVTSSSSSSGG